MLVLERPTSNNFFKSCLQAAGIWVGTALFEESAPDGVYVWPRPVYFGPTAVLLLVINTLSSSHLSGERVSGQGLQGNALKASNFGTEFPRKYMNLWMKDGF